MMQPYAIGIDIGTGSTKAVAVTNGGHVIASAQFYYPILRAEAGFSEQNPEKIWTAFVQCIQGISSQLKEPPEVISLSSCMHSLIAVDDGVKPITNLITWADTRSEAIADTLRQSEEGELIYSTTGTPVHSMSPLCKIIWLREHLPEVFTQAAKFISIKEYI